MRGQSLPLIVGVPGFELTADELDVLERISPAGVILFSKNVADEAQLRSLVAQIQELDPTPFLCIDLEGGLVNRLTSIWGELPSPSEAAAGGRRAVRALGEAAGAACRSLNIQLDLAPVIDLSRSQGLVTSQLRTMSDEVERTTVLATVFYEGLASWCVGGCLKHFPGLGEVATDTHDELPVVELDGDDLAPHLAVFEVLSPLISAVMVGHVVVPSLGDAENPASLSPTVVERAIALPGSPVVLSDDLEMGALAGRGDLPELVLAAIRARNHGVFVCHAFDRLNEIAGRIDAAARGDEVFRTRLEEATARLGTMRRELCLTGASQPAPDHDTVAQLWEAARQAVMD